jgi:hypothetical protein
MTSITELLELRPGSLVVLGEPVMITETDQAAGVLLSTLAEQGYSVGQTVEILQNAMFWAVYGAAVQKAAPHKKK